MKKIGLAWERQNSFGDRFCCFRVVRIVVVFCFLRSEEKVPVCAKTSRSKDKKDLSEREAATPRQRYGLSEQRALQMTISRVKKGGENIREEGSGRGRGRKREETNVDGLVRGGEEEEEDGYWGGITQSSEEGGGVDERGNIPPCPH